MFSFFKNFLKKNFIDAAAIEHSSKGNYTKTNRLSGGGHGQEALDYMDKNGIEYNITHIYPNGVRIGNVPHHVKVKKRSGENQSWFPKSWSRETIFQAGRAVSRGRKFPDGFTKSGVHKKVKVGIIRTGGKIATIFPLSKQKEGKRKK